MLIGAIASFLGATCQAGNYALTQTCQQHHKLDGIRLLVAVHIAMGCISLFPIIIFGYWHYIHFSQISSLILVNAPYLVAQFCLIKAIKHSDPSIASPLLALKIPVLACISILFFNQHFGLNQWGAIFLILSTAVFFSRLSGSLSVKPLLLVLCASVGYSLSDIAITDFSKSIVDLPAFQQTTICIAINYLFCGAISLPLVRFTKVTPKIVYQAKWVALAWYVSVLFLIFGFNLSGVVSGNIIQSLRGVIGVLFAFLFFRHQLNQPARIWWKKLLGSIFMFVSTGLFYF